jgi:UDP-N-acetylmuramoyl-tripeptide--D-alanyl-D-alanine ligase
VAALDMAAQGRRVAFLGDMLELGPRGPELHRATARAVAPRLQALVAVGAQAEHLLAGAREGGLPAEALHAFADSEQAAAAAPGLLRPGDAVLVKGSRGVRMEKVVDALAGHFGALEA